MLGIQRRRRDRSPQPPADPAGSAPPAGTTDGAPESEATEAPITRLADGVQPVSLDGLEQLLERGLEVERTKSFAEREAFLQRYQLTDGQNTLPEDPFSEEYRLAQLDLYKVIAGVDDYVPAVNEIMAVDVEAKLRQPAPFDAGTTAAAADHLIAYGFIFRMLNLAPGARVIEYGAGQGNLALLLATAGIGVTAIDISPGYVELMQRRAARADLPLEAIVGEFGDAPPDGAQVDAILFYEAFHHASDHAQLIRTLRGRLKPGGRVVFAGEPIIDSPVQPWDGPWGVRLDGVSLWAIRQHHCLELGFASPYFREMLERNGFSVTFHECRETAIGNTWVATPLD
jgi:SAM-dependent methyltransferase